VNEWFGVARAFTPTRRCVNMPTEPHSTDRSGKAEQTMPSAQISDSRSANGLSEDDALALLKRPDATAERLAQLAKNPIASKSRKVLVALASHPRTPRHVSIPLLRSIFTFDLMNFALMPAVAPDVKRAAEEQLITRLESLPLGQKITLARRASGRVAAALLQSSDQRIISPALNNKQLTDPLIVQALMKPRAPEGLFVLVSDHPTWRLRREVQIALLRSQKTPLGCTQELAKNFSAEFLREIVPAQRIGELRDLQD
jgi:hypothetical protein